MSTSYDTVTSSKSKTSKTGGGGDDVLAATSQLTPTQQAWVKRLGITETNKTPVLSAEVVAKELVTRLTRQDRDNILEALGKTADMTYVAALTIEIEKQQTEADQKKQEESQKNQPTVTEGMFEETEAKVDIEAKLDGEKAKNSSQRNLATLKAKPKELRGSASTQMVDTVLKVAKEEVDQTTDLPEQLNISDAKFPDQQIDFGIWGIRAQFAKLVRLEELQSWPGIPAATYQALGQDLAQTVKQQVAPLHQGGTKTELAQGGQEWRAAELVKIAPGVKQAEDVAKQVQDWKNTKARAGFDVALTRMAPALKMRLDNANWSAADPQYLPLWCEDVLSGSLKEERGGQEGTMAIVGDIHGSTESISDRIALAAGDKPMAMLMAKVRAAAYEGQKSAMDLALRDVAREPLRSRFLGFALQSVGDITSKGTGTLKTFQELVYLDQLRSHAAQAKAMEEAKAANKDELTVKKEGAEAAAQDEGVGFVYGNHEWTLSQLLRNPSEKNFLGYFPSWFLKKQGYLLLESAVDEPGFAEWLEGMSINETDPAQIVKSDAEVKGSGKTMKALCQELQQLKELTESKDDLKKAGVFGYSKEDTKAARGLLQSDPKAVVGWIYMKYKLFDPKGSDMGKFLFQKHAKILQVQERGGRVMLFSHGDLSQKMITRLSNGIKDDMAKEKKLETLRANVNAVNDEFGNALCVEDDVAREDAIKKLGNQFGMYFDEFYHGGEGGKKEPDDKKDPSATAKFNREIDFFAMAGIDAHFSGHSPQVQAGTQTKSTNLRKIKDQHGKEVTVSVEDYKIDIDEFGEGGSASGNVVSVDASGKVWGFFYDKVGAPQNVKLGTLAQN